MATQLETLVITLEAQIKQFKVELAEAVSETRKAVARIEAITEASAKRQEVAWEKAGASAGRAYQRGATRSFVGRGARGGIVGLVLGTVFNISMIEAAAKAGDQSAQAFLKAWDPVARDIKTKLSNAIIGALKYAFPNAMRDVPAQFETIINRTPGAIPSIFSRRTGAQITPAISGASTEIVKLINDAAAQNHVNALLITEVMRQESNLGRNLGPSSKGAIGAMQLMPDTAARLGVNPYVMTENVMGGAKLLAQLMVQFKGDVAAVIAAYHGGTGADVQAYAKTHDLKALAASSPLTAAYTSAVLARLQAYTVAPGFGPRSTLYSSQGATVSRSGPHPASPVTGVGGTASLLQEQQQASALVDQQAKSYLELTKNLQDWSEHQSTAISLTNAETANNKELVDSIKAEAQARALNVEKGTLEYSLIETIIRQQRQQEEELKKHAYLMQTVGQLNDDLASSSETFAKALLDGKSATEALNAALNELASDLLHMAFQSLFRGAGGQGGLLGDLLGLPANQAGGLYRVAGSSGEHPVMLSARRGEMITVSPRGLSRGGHGGMTIGGTVINIQGNADEKTIAIMERRMQASQAKQMKELQRNWGNMTNRYQQLRGP